MSLMGKRIAQRRKAMRMTQAEVAALSDCSELFVRELEKGKPTVRFDKAIAVLATVGFELKLVNGPAGISIGDE
jgi:y4mF family transcriptional regulator